MKTLTKIATIVLASSLMSACVTSMDYRHAQRHHYYNRTYSYYYYPNTPYYYYDNWDLYSNRDYYASPYYNAYSSYDYPYYTSSYWSDRAWHY